MNYEIRLLITNLKQAATRMYSAAAVLRDVKDDRAVAARKLLIDSAREVDAVLLSFGKIGITSK